MKKERLTKVDVVALIESRLSMQSTQRNLLGYGVSTPTLEYISSESFYNKRYKNFTEIQKRGFLQLLAGPFNWTKARQLIEEREY